MTERSADEAGAPAAPKLRHVLPVSRRDAAEGSSAPFVMCPRRGDSVAVRDCGTCEHCLGMVVNVTGIGTLLKCAWGEQSSAPEAVGVVPATVPAHGPRVGELMTGAACLARPDTTVESVADQLLQYGLDAIAVQDERGAAVGVVSTSDLLRKYFEDGDTGELVADAAQLQQAGVSMHPVLAGQSSVSDVMSHPVFGLSADASVGRAAALMAYEGVHQLVVFHDDGRIAGVLSSLDILRWLADQAGFVVPRRDRGKRE